MVIFIRINIHLVSLNFPQMVTLVDRFGRVKYINKVSGNESVEENLPGFLVSEH